MKNTPYLLLLLVLFIATFNSNAQSVGVNTNMPADQAATEITDTTQGTPAPRKPAKAGAAERTSSVCINEVDSDTPGTDNAEYIELSGTPNGSLNHFVVVLFNGANDLSYRAYDLDGFSLDANGFFLIGNAGVAGVDIVIPNGTLQNGADAVALYDTTSFVILSFTTTVNLVDAIVYDTDQPDDMGLLTGLGQTVQYNENENGMSETQSISRSTDCGSSIVTQNPTPNATNGMSSCPSYSGAPNNVGITNSTCNSSCVAAGGLISAPTGTLCPSGSTLQYQVNSGTWTSTLPVYDQDGPSQSIKTRCSCDSDNTMNSPESIAVTTMPANCTDNTLPMITCPGNIPVANTPGLCSAVVTYTTPVGTDNCSGAVTTQTLGLPSGASYPVGATTNIFKVTDANGNTATCAFAVSVTDTQLPTITCPTNIAVANTPGLCSAVVSYTTPAGSDNCSGAVTTQTLGLPSGASYPVGATTNIFKVTDANGNTATCAFAVSVTDTQLPTITCPANVSAGSSSGLCGAIVNFTTPAGTDNCSGPSTLQTSGLPTGSTFPVGSTINTFRVTDAFGNSATCAFTVTVFDTQLPTITCPANVSTGSSSGLCGAIVNFTTPAGTDNCSGPSTTQTSGLPTGSTFPVGSTINTFRVTDASGNSAICAFTVTVTDTQLPSITCPGNIPVANTPGFCSAVVSYTTPVGSDNCSGAVTVQTLGLPSGATYPVGATTNIFKVTDAAGNTSTCAFAVSVTDTQLPTISCPANISTSSPSGLCGAVVSYATPAGTDNCSGPSTTQTSGLPTGSSFPVGSTINTFRVTDAFGNSATCAFTVTVFDTQLPTITCPANVSTGSSSGLCGAMVSYTTPAGTDNCSGPTTTQTSGLPTGSSFPVGSTINTFRVTDASGNSATCAFTVTVFDTQLPTISCPANVSTGSSSGLCGAIVSYTTPAGTDNCSGPTTTQTSGLPTGSSFPVGSTINTFRVTDASGNSATCAFTVTVTDNQLPTITCPANVSTGSPSGLCGAVVSYATPAGTDNCSGPSTTQISGLPSGSTFPVGSTINTFRVTDASGNSATCAFTVTVTDTQLPTIACPANVSVGNTPGLCGAIVNYTTPVGADNCSGPSTTQISGLPSGGTFPVGSTVNSFRVTDASGNSATCAFTVTISDTQAPTMICQNATITLNGSGQATLTVAQVNNGSFDNCAISSFMLSKTLFTCANVGANNVILSGKDASNNQGQCTAIVTVVDPVLPIAKCKNAIANLGTNGLVTVPPSAVNNGSTDNCSFTLTLSPNVFNCASIGNNVVTLKATDNGGNTATCIARVTVRDASGPTALCKNPTIFLNNVGQATLSIADVNNGSADNCGIGSMSINKTMFNCSEIGSTQPVTLTLTDVNGNTSSCISNVTVKDVITPTAVCENVTVGLSNNGPAIVYGADLAIESTDNCSIWSYSPIAKIYSAPGTYNLSITVKDWSGNAATCVSVVVVEAPSPSGSTQEYAERSDVNAADLAHNVYPNPSTGDFAIAFELPTEQTVLIKLFDLQGRVILNQEFQGTAGENTLPMGLYGLSSGVYLLDFQSRGFNWRTKVVIQE